MTTILVNLRVLNYLIFDLLDDKSILNLATTNKAYYTYCFNKQYFKHRIWNLYSSSVIDHKPSDIGYKQQYIDIINILYKTGVNEYLSGSCWRFDLIIAVNKVFGWCPREYDIHKHLSKNLKLFLE